MKLNCGPTRYIRNLRRRAYLSDWHKFFVLWPRRITDTEQCVWFEFIERRGSYHPINRHGGYWNWKYRVIDLTSQS